MSLDTHIKPPLQIAFKDPDVPTIRGRHFLMPAAIFNLFQASDTKAEVDRQTVFARIALYCPACGRRDPIQNSKRRL
jgi:hypothetical protein